MIELERTFLLKKLPQNIQESPSKEITDKYFPKQNKHPVLRLRKSGDKLEITKKVPIADDASEQEETTIKLTPQEYDSLNACEGKSVRKIRYYYKVEGQTAEIDIFQDELEGLAIADFEFDSRQEKNSFTPPEFCGEDITQEDFIAGGMICGKSYEDIEENLEKYDYKKLHLS